MVNDREKRFPSELPTRRTALNPANACSDRAISLPSISSPPRTRRTATRAFAPGPRAAAPPSPACPAPAAAPAASIGDSRAAHPGRGRRLFFRCTRLVLAGGLLAAAGNYAQRTMNSATSEQAYINAELTALRAPIEGQLRLEAVQPGALMPRGATVFSVRNSRFGNQEAMAQWNWLQELTDRLRSEAEEAAVRCRRQEQVHQVHEKLHREKLISDLAFIEEDTKLALAQTALTNKQAQARQAEARLLDVERQVELQKEAMVQMPFDGVAWTIPARAGDQVAAHEPVIQVVDPRHIRVDAFFHEKFAPRLQVGAPVTIRALDGGQTWPGRVESVRGGVGRIAFDAFSGGQPENLPRRRVAVRVAMESANPYTPGEFLGVGRSVVVSLDNGD